MEWRRSLRRAGLPAVVLLPLLVLSSCGGDNSEEPPPSSDAEDVVLTATLLPDSVITLSFEDGFSAAFPSGSVSDPTQIILTRESHVASPDAYFRLVSVGSLYDLSPSGLTLAKPATLRLPMAGLSLPAGLSETDLAMATVNGTSRDLLTTAVFEGVLVAATSHFSPLAVTPRGTTAAWTNSAPLNAWLEGDWLRLGGLTSTAGVGASLLLFDEARTRPLSFCTNYRTELVRDLGLSGTEVIYRREIKRICWLNGATGGTDFRWTPGSAGEGIGAGQFTLAAGAATQAGEPYGREVSYRPTGSGLEDWTYSVSGIRHLTAADAGFVHDPYFTDEAGQFAPVSLLQPYQDTDRFFVRVRVTYSAGFLLSGDSGGTYESEYFAKADLSPGNYPAPQVEITSPVSGAYVTAGTPIQFQAEVAPAEGATWDPADVVWSSNRIGQFGTGAEFTWTELDQGAHQITCRVIDSRGKIGSDQVSIEVVGPTSGEDPELTLPAPSDTSTGQVRIAYSFTDREGDSADWVIRYATAGSVDWHFASVIATSAGRLAPYGSGGIRIAGIPPGAREFTWDSAADLPEYRENVRLQMTYLRPTGVEAWAREITFPLRNSPPRPLCETEPAELEFGFVGVGGSQERTFVVRNAGEGTLSGAITEECDSYEIITGGGEYALGAGEERVAVVRFAPTAEGTHSCLIALGNDLCNGVSCAGVALPDTQSPEVEITNPEAGATVAGIVSLRATATDNLAVTRVEFSVSVGQLWIPIGTDAIAPFEISWNSHSVIDGAHTLRAIAYDGAGNSGTVERSVTVYNPFIDETPPARVTDLSVVRPTSSSLTLVWTAVGDDSTSGRAARYDVRYASSEITPANWSSATAIPAPVPRFSGLPESLLVVGLAPFTTYHFALLAGDEVPNWGELSNDLTGITTAVLPAEEGFAWVPSGTFLMGSPPSEPGRFDHEVQHEVTISRAFYAADHEVTQAEWQEVIGWNDAIHPGEEHPVENVTWFDAVQYCNERSRREGKTPVYTLGRIVYDGNRRHITDAVVGEPAWLADGYRLPTEAEWEYMCRATTLTAFYSGAITQPDPDCEPDGNLNLAGWYCGNAGGAPHNTGGKLGNPWGLFDLHGNVAEWCWDYYGSLYTTEKVVDPRGPAAGTYRFIRGGSWSEYARFCRSASRTFIGPDDRRGDIGLRVVRSAP